MKIRKSIYKSSILSLKLFVYQLSPFLTYYLIIDCVRLSNPYFKIQYPIDSVNHFEERTELLKRNAFICHCLGDCAPTNLLCLFFCMCLSVWAPLHSFFLSNYGSGFNGTWWKWSRLKSPIDCVKISRKSNKWWRHSYLYVSCLRGF